MAGTITVGLAFTMTLSKGVNEQRSVEKNCWLGFIGPMGRYDGGEVEEGNKKEKGKRRRKGRTEGRYWIGRKISNYFECSIDIGLPGHTASVVL